MRIIFHERHHKAVRRGAREGLPQPCAGFLPLSQVFIGCRCLDADVQGYQCVMHGLAHRQQLCAVPDDLGISALSKIHLIFDHLHHGLARREHIDVRETVQGEDLRNFVRFTSQGMVVGAGGAPEVDPRGVVIAQQRCVSLLKGIALLHIGMQREPPRQKIAAQRHVDLSVVLHLCIGPLQFNVGIREAPLTEQRLGAHDGLCTLPVVIRDLVIMGHALVHLRKLAFHRSRCTVEHHQNGR